MFFASDNAAGAHPAIAEALTSNAGGFAAPYGASEIDKRAEAAFSEIFGREVAVLFVATGTAANSLALAAASKPGSIALCHTEAHVVEDECGAPEFYSGGRLRSVSGKDGKIDPAALRAKLDGFDLNFVHHGRPSAVTITQATEIGTVYDADHIRQIGEIASDFDVPLHMDGARFANALVSLDISPAGMTSDLGVDYLSFGGTKNGCWCAEALILFNPDRARELAFARKRAGQLFSKSRFIAAQFLAYFENGLWLNLARHSNVMAAELAAGFEKAEAVRLAWQPQANEVFAFIDQRRASELQEKGAVFYDWPVPAAYEGDCDESETLYRFVTSFATKPEEVSRFLVQLTS